MRHSSVVAQRLVCRWSWYRILEKSTFFIVPYSHPLVVEHRTNNFHGAVLDNYISVADQLAADINYLHERYLYQSCVNI
jgi:hypothetical protein